MVTSPMDAIRNFWLWITGGMKTTGVIAATTTASVTAYTVNRVDLTNILGAIAIGLALFFVVRALLKDRRRR